MPKIPRLAASVAVAAATVAVVGHGRADASTACALPLGYKLVHNGQTVGKVASELHSYGRIVWQLRGVYGDHYEARRYPACNPVDHVLVGFWTSPQQISGVLTVNWKAWL